MIYSGFKGFPRRLIAYVEVAEEPDRPGDDPAPVGAINHVYSDVCIGSRPNKYFFGGLSIGAPAVRLPYRGHASRKTHRINIGGTNLMPVMANLLLSAA